ncbi:hypothetical protein ACFL6Y_09100 [Elusimicrobiota bacterium]
MIRIKQYYFLPLILLWSFGVMHVSAQENKSKGDIALESREFLYEGKGYGLDFICFGQSFLKDGKLLEKVEFLWNRNFKGIAVRKMLKVFILWSGEVKEFDKQVKRIFLTAGGRSKEVQAGYFKWQRSTGYVYTAAADVTSFIKGNSNIIAVSGLRSDAMENKTYSVGGFAFVVVFDTSEEKKFLVRVMPGPWLLSPGERHYLKLAAGKSSIKLDKLGIIGGHGIKGNAGGNLLNNRAITGGDDWSGSSGEKWDVNMHMNLKGAKSREWTLTFDPLLEWIFPAGIITKYLLH